jgi:hypothetical protein
MSMIRIDKSALIRTIVGNTDANEQDARAIINTVMFKQEKEHGSKCQEDRSWMDVCEGTYADKVDECLRLVETIRAIYALAGENPQIKNLVDEALIDYD